MPKKFAPKNPEIDESVILLPMFDMNIYFNVFVYYARRNRISQVNTCDCYCLCIQFNSKVNVNNRK